MLECLHARIPDTHERHQPKPPMSERIAYPDWRLETLGDRCLMVVFPAMVDPTVNSAVHALAAAMEDQLPAGCELVPAFRTLAVHWRPAPASADRDWVSVLEARLHQLLAAGYRPTADAGRLVTIPVCYGGDYGPDLDAVATASRSGP